MPGSNRGYKIRRFTNGRNKDGEPFINYSLTIPAEIAEALPKDQQYICTLTKDGILFAPRSDELPPVDLPKWAEKAVAEQGTRNGTPTTRPAPK